jgi:hypothetical protein
MSDRIASDPCLVAGLTERFVGRLTWDEVARRLESGAAAILPIGAGAKKHGFHLPMNTDQLQAEWLASRIADRTGALIWPTLAYGYYPAWSLCPLPGEPRRRVTGVHPTSRSPAPRFV